MSIWWERHARLGPQARLLPRMEKWRYAMVGPPHRLFMRPSRNLKRSTSSWRLFRSCRSLCCSRLVRRSCCSRYRRIGWCHEPTKPPPRQSLEPPAVIVTEAKIHPSYSSRLIGLAMLVGVVVAMAVTPSRSRDCVKQFFEGAGFGFTHIVSLIVTANCFGKSIEAAGLAEATGPAHRRIAAITRTDGSVRSAGLRGRKRFRNGEYAKSLRFLPRSGQGARHRSGVGGRACLSRCSRGEDDVACRGSGTHVRNTDQDKSLHTGEASCGTLVGRNGCCGHPPHEWSALMVAGWGCTNLPLRFTLGRGLALSGRPHGCESACMRTDEFAGWSRSL